MRIGVPAVPVLLLLTSCMTQEDPAPPTPLEEVVEAACSAHAGRDVCVAWRDLATGETYLRFGDLVLHAASTMKLAVMYEAFRQHEAGRVDLEAGLPVKNRFRSVEDGSEYRLAADDDSEKDLYRHVGRELPMRDLVRRMMVRSSNLATNLLVEALDPSRIQATLEGLGVRRMKVLRGVEDGPAFRAGKNNVCTARDLMVLLQAIWEGRDVSDASRAAMVGILLAQEFNDLIPAGVPEGTPVAHKTGWITGIRHDAAVVAPEGRAPYVLVVLTRGFDRAAAEPVIQEISRLVWQHHVPQE